MFITIVGSLPALDQASSLDDSSSVSHLRGLYQILGSRADVFPKFSRFDIGVYLISHRSGPIKVAFGVVGLPLVAAGAQLWLASIN